MNQWHSRCVHRDQSLCTDSESVHILSHSRWTYSQLESPYFWYSIQSQRGLTAPWIRISSYKSHATPFPPHSCCSVNSGMISSLFQAIVSIRRSLIRRLVSGFSRWQQVCLLDLHSDWHHGTCSRHLHSLTSILTLQSERYIVCFRRLLRWTYTNRQWWWWNFYEINVHSHWPEVWYLSMCNGNQSHRAISYCTQ